MSLKKKLAKSAVGFLFATFLTLAVLSFSLFQITDKETIKPIVLAIASKQIPEGQLDQIYDYVIQQCGAQERIEIALQNEKVLIDCNKIRGSPPEKMLEIIYAENIEKLYNLQYNCEFLDCLRSQPTVILSAKANNFFLSATYASVILTVVFGILLALLSRDSGWGIMRAFGWSFLFVGVSYFIVLGAKALIIPPNIAEIAGPGIDIIFNIILFNLLLVLVAGVALLAIGYIGPRLQGKGKKK